MRAEKNRITVFEQVSFQEAGTPRVVQSETRVAHDLASDQDPVQRWAKVGKDWKPLDLGWLMEVGLLCVLHKKREWSRQPTAEERAEAESAVVELGFCDSEGEMARTDMLLRYGDSLRLSPNRHLRVRSNVATRIYVTAFPR